MRIVVVDNYDSFVHNLASYLTELGAEVDLWRNDDARLEDADLVARRYDGVLISPGPGTPEAAGHSIEVVRQQAGRVPILGVCLGLQAIAVAFGALVSAAPELRHGQTSSITHDGRGVFTGLPSPFRATRYHSLAVEPATLPESLQVSATSESGVVMALRHRDLGHRDLAVEGVQFHPESILTEHGHQLLGNWLSQIDRSRSQR